MSKPSIEFVRQKEVGREFEQAMIPHLEEAGLRVIDVDHWSYNHKKGRDHIVEKDGYRNSLELKLDRMSEKTHKVCIDLDSLRKTTSAIWIFGFPRGNEVDVYTVKYLDLHPYVYQYARENPTAVKKVGEWKQECVMIPKWTFINLPFVFKFKTIVL